MTNGTRRGWGVSVTPLPLFTPRKDPVPIVQEAVWAPGPGWTGAKNLAKPGIRSPDRPALSQSLYRPRYLARVSLHVQYPSFLSDFNEAWIFLTDFHENPSEYKTSYFMRTDGQTQRNDEDFRNFQNSPKMGMNTRKSGRKCVSLVCLFVHPFSRIYNIGHNNKEKGKAIPLQAWTGPEGSRWLRLPDFKAVGTWRW